MVVLPLIGQDHAACCTVREVGLPPSYHIVVLANVFVAAAASWCGGHPEVSAGAMSAWC